MRALRRFALAAVSIAGAAFPLRTARVDAAAEPALFPFVVPWDDASAGTATDLAFLNATPAGTNGFVVVAKAGTFAEEKTGRRLRFLATNLAGRAAFPSPADAEKIAARMAKLGLNLVRLHHLQNGWEASIWKKGRAFVEIDPAQVDRLDALVAALKRHGLYVNLNLSTTREYVPELGFPESVRRIPFTHHKKVDKFDRQMIELQKEYARALLDHVNPHTRLAYRDEPALAFVEINNENSLVGWPGEAPGEGLTGLPEPFRAELVALWNSWLAGRYRDDAALAAAWSEEGVPEHGPSLVAAGSALVFENQSDAGFASAERLTSAGGTEGAGGLRVRVNRDGGGEWLAQAQAPGLTLEKGEAYTLRFRAKADPPRTLSLKVHLDRPDWRDHGLRGTASLGREWREYALTFRARDVLPRHSRVAFLLGNAAGTVEIDDVRLRAGTAPFALAPGQSLVARRVDLAGDAGSGRRHFDWVEFLAGTEKAYSEEMRGFLKRDLGLRALVIDTQISWGGLTSLSREAAMDFADNHAYWQHPEFLGRSWDPVNWRIGRRSLVAEMQTGQGTLGDLARWRVAGRPYTISEYNHPAPSDYQAEMMPLLASFAALQDWDALYGFAYAATGAGEDNEALQGFFDCGIDPAKVAFYPSTALLFREGLVPPLAARDTLVLPAVPWRDGLDAAVAWTRTGGLPDALRTRVALVAGSRPDVQRTRADAAPAAERRAPDPARVAMGTRGAVYLVDAPAAKVIVGFVGGGDWTLDGLSASFPRFGAKDEGFAALTVVARDGKPLARSDRLLVTAVGRVENQEMGWNAERTSVGDRWGHGPVSAEGIPGRIALRLATPARVYALDGRGARKAALRASWADGLLSFEIGPGNRTLWYEVARR